MSDANQDCWSKETKEMVERHVRELVVSDLVLAVQAAHPKIEAGPERDELMRVVGSLFAVWPMMGDLVLARGGSYPVPVVKERP